MRFNDSDIGNLNVYSESNEIKNLATKKTTDLPELLNKKAKNYNYADHIPRPVFTGSFKKQVHNVYPNGTKVILKKNEHIYRDVTVVIVGVEIDNNGDAIYRFNLPGLSGLRWGSMYGKKSDFRMLDNSTPSKKIAGPVKGKHTVMCTDLDIRQGRCIPIKYYKPESVNKEKRIIKTIKLGDILFDKVDGESLPFGIKHLGGGMASLMNYITEASSDALKKQGFPGIEWVNIEYETERYPNGLDEILTNMDTALINPMKNLIFGGGYCSSGEDCDPLGSNYVIPVNKGVPSNIVLGSSVLYDKTLQKYDAFTVDKDVTEDDTIVELTNVSDKKKSKINSADLIPAANTNAIMNESILNLSKILGGVKGIGKVKTITDEPKVNVELFDFTPTIIMPPTISSFVYEYDKDDNNISTTDKLTILRQTTSCKYTCKLKIYVIFTLKLEEPLNDDKSYWTYTNDTTSYKYFYKTSKWYKIKYINMAVAGNFSETLISLSNFLKENKIICIAPTYKAYPFINNLGRFKKKALSYKGLDFDATPATSTFCTALKGTDIKNLKPKLKDIIVTMPDTTKNADGTFTKGVSGGSGAVTVNFFDSEITGFTKFFNEVCIAPTLTQKKYLIKDYKNITRDNLTFLFKAKDSVHVLNKTDTKKHKIKTVVYYIKKNSIGDDNYYINSSNSSNYIGIIGNKEVYIKQNNEYKKILPTSGGVKISYDSTKHIYLIKTKKEHLIIDEQSSQQYIEVDNIPDTIPYVRGIIPGIMEDVLRTLSMPLYQLGLDPRLLLNKTQKWTDREITIGEYKHKNPSNSTIFIQYCLEKEWLLNKIFITGTTDKTYTPLALLWLDSKRYTTLPNDGKTPDVRLTKIKFNNPFLTYCKKISGVSDFPVTETLRIFYYGKCMDLVYRVYFGSKPFNKKLSESLKLHADSDFIKKVDDAIFEASKIQTNKPNKEDLYQITQEKFGLSILEHDSEKHREIMDKYNLINKSTWNIQLSYILYPYKDIFTHFDHGDNIKTYINYLHFFKKDFISSYKIKGQTKEIVEGFTFSENKTIILFLLCVLVLILIYTYIK